MIIDAEHGLDWAYAQAIGVKPAFCYIQQPTSAEEALKLLLNTCRAEDISVVVLDSVAALVTAMELEGEIGDANIAAVARLMSANMKKLNAICSVNETLAIMINQNRSNPGAYGAIYQTGGRSLKFYASMRINVRKVSTNKKGNVAISNETEIEFKKNKLSIPYTKGSFDLVFGKGADNGKAIIEIGAKHGVIEKKGAYIAYKGAQLGQGINGASSLIEADKDLREQIIQEIKEAVAAKKKTVEPEAKEKASAVAAVSKPLKAKGGFAKRSLSLVSPEDDD